MWLIFVSRIRIYKTVPNIHITGNNLVSLSGVSQYCKIACWNLYMSSRIYIVFNQLFPRLFHCLDTSLCSTIAVRESHRSKPVMNTQGWSGHVGNKLRPTIRRQFVRYSISYKGSSKYINKSLGSILSSFNQRPYGISVHNDEVAHPLVVK